MTTTVRDLSQKEITIARIAGQLLGGLLTQVTELEDQDIRRAVLVATQIVAETRKRDIP
jgi:hypothetical protein